MYITWYIERKQTSYKMKDAWPSGDAEVILILWSLDWLHQVVTVSLIKTLHIVHVFYIQLYTYISCILLEVITVQNTNWHRVLHIHFSMHFFPEFYFPKSVSIVPILCCDWYLKLYFVTSNFHRDTGVGERMEKGTMPLHLQKDVLNDCVQGHTPIYLLPNFETFAKFQLYIH